MKVRLLNGYPASTGKSGELIYCYDRKTDRLYSRRYTYPELTENNHKMGSIAANLFKLEPSVEFKCDCRTYAYYYQSLRIPNKKKIWTWSNCYTKLMYAMKAAMPEIDLLTLTKQEIYDQDLPCISIKRAVEAGLLDPVDNYARLDAQI